MSKNKSGPKVLIFDLETSYLETIIKHWDSHTNDYITHDKMKIKEWSVLSYSAKWLGEKKMMYKDTRKKKDPRDDKELITELRELINQADIIITKNGKRFDEKMFNARCLKHGLTPPSSYQHIDVEKIIRKKFKLVSYSLDYLCEFLDTEHKKLKHGEFPGMKLWDECLAGNTKAWNEMKKYNNWDVLSTEDCYNIVQCWDQSVKFDVYNNHINIQCNCGSYNLIKRGYAYSKSGKFHKLQCKECGAWHQDKQNLLTKEKKASLLK